MGTAQCRFQLGDAPLGIQLRCLDGVDAVRPGRLPELLVLLPPPPNQRLAEAILPAQLGHPLLASQRLGGYLALEFTAKGSLHRSAPSRAAGGRTSSMYPASGGSASIFAPAFATPMCVSA